MLALRTDRLHGGGCGCVTAGGLSRRLFLGAGAGALMCAASKSFAYSGNYEFMLLSCMDPRIVYIVHQQMNARNFRGEYSQVVVAGGPVAVVADAFRDWQGTVWSNLDTTVKLHNIKRVFGLTHRDCGAVKIGYGDAAVATPQIERETHVRILRAFRAEVAKRHPPLKVDTGILALDGAIEMIAA